MSFRVYTEANDVQLVATRQLCRGGFADMKKPADFSAGCRYLHILSCFYMQIRRWSMQKKQTARFPVPRFSECFYLFQIGHRIRMSTEVDLQALHICQSEKQMEIFRQSMVFLCGK